MTTVAGRCLVVVVAVLAAGGLVTAGAVHADTGDLTYSCGLPIGDRDFLIGAGTNAPQVVYLGTSFSPVLRTTAQIPAELANLATSSLKATEMAGTLVTTVTAGGITTSVTQKIVRRAIPADTSVPVPVVATGALPRLSPTTAGSVVYLPGNVEVVLQFFKANGGSAATFSDITCAKPATGATIDKVGFAKSPTRTTLAATSKKSTKKVSAKASLASTSGVPASGKVTFALYKGGKKVRSVSKTLSGGKAAATFSRVKKKGTYKVVATYGGSSALNGSKASRTFKVT